MLTSDLQANIIKQQRRDREIPGWNVDGKTMMTSLIPLGHVTYITGVLYGNSIVIPKCIWLSLYQFEATFWNTQALKSAAFLQENITNKIHSLTIRIPPFPPKSSFKRLSICIVFLEPLIFLIRHHPLWSTSSQYTMLPIHK